MYFIVFICILIFLYLLWILFMLLLCGDIEVNFGLYEYIIILDDLVDSIFNLFYLILENLILIVYFNV